MPKNLTKIEVRVAKVWGSPMPIDRVLWTDPFFGYPWLESQRAWAKRFFASIVSDIFARHHAPVRATDDERKQIITASMQLAIGMGNKAKLGKIFLGTKWFHEENDDAKHRLRMLANDDPQRVIPLHADQIIWRCVQLNSDNASRFAYSKLTEPAVDRVQQWKIIKTVLSRTQDQWYAMYMVRPDSMPFDLFEFAGTDEGRVIADTAAEHGASFAVENLSFMAKN